MLGITVRCFRVAQSKFHIDRARACSHAPVTSHKVKHMGRLVDTRGANHVPVLSPAFARGGHALVLPDVLVALYINQMA